MSRRNSRSETPTEQLWAPTSWPGDAATVERWFRTELLAAVGDDRLRLSGLDGIRTTVELDGTDVARLLIDATGVALTVDVGAGTASAGTDAAQPIHPQIITRTPGALRFARVIADPVTLQGHELHLDATVQDLLFDWVRYAEPTSPGRPSSAFGIEDAASEHPTGSGHPAGTFAVSMRTDKIDPLIASIAQPLLAESGIRLRRLKTDLAEGRRQTIKLHALASVRWKIFGATVRATFVVQIERDGVITVKQLRLRSSNPVIAIVLLMARSELRRVEGQKLDLNEGCEALRLHDLRVSIAESVEISGRLG